VIVPGSSYKEPSNGAVTVVYILLGVVIGAALIWFLVMPARFTGMRSEYNQTLQEYSEQLSSGNVELNALENQYEQVKTEKENLEEKLSEISSADGSNKLLLTVVASANNYLAGKMTDAAVDLIDIDVSSLPSEDAKTLYNTIAAATMMDAATDLYGQGLTYYQRKEYATSVDYMVKSYKCDKTKVDAICYAARGYAELGDTENAKRYYNLIIDGFKTSKYVAEATTYVNTN
jgi:tetratricopeptide (TPR) repeat protein